MPVRVPRALVRRWVPLAAGLLVACGSAGREGPGAAEEGLRTTPLSTDPVAAKAPPRLLFELDAAENAVLDPRAERVRGRSFALLAVETQQLDVLLRSTDPASRVRPQLLRRLAEDNVELADAAEREARAAESRGDAGTLHSRLSSSARARLAAIASYTALVEAPSSKSYPLLDQAEWDLALECARVGDAPGARRAGLRVVTEYPETPYASRAYLLFGAMFAAEAATDPSKYRLAEEAFSKASRSSDGALVSVALRRLEATARLAGDTTAADAAERRLSGALGSSSAASSSSAGLSTSSASPTPLTAPAGCTKDVDCKGDRICEDGRCVSPR